jgi:mannitol/fructose-specific phosphotransferase system IIA component (Ntr-type)
MTIKELLGFLEADLFIPNLPPGDKASTLQHLVEHLKERGRISSDKVVLNALMTRENMGSTGIGKGIAIPHSRTLVANRLTVVAARSLEGIEFDAMDNKPVHLIFLILAPPQEKNNQYLPLLGRLVETLREASVRKKLLSATDFNEFVAVLEQVPVE